MVVADSDAQCRVPGQGFGQLPELLDGHIDSYVICHCLPLKPRWPAGALKPPQSTDLRGRMFSGDAIVPG
jgi:hypothetical protein